MVFHNNIGTNVQYQLASNINQSRDSEFPKHISTKGWDQDNVFNFAHSPAHQKSASDLTNVAVIIKSPRFKISLLPNYGEITRFAHD